MRPTAQNAFAHAIRTLAADRSPGCLLDGQGTFLFVNEAWDRFAEENGGAPACLGDRLIGTRWLDHIAGEEVRATHATLLARALRPAPPGGHPALVQVVECNTPTRSALVSTRLDPVLLHGSEPVGVAIVHATVRERPIDEVYEPVRRPVDAYRDAAGAAVQCSCCRRLRDPRDPERWDLVPDALAAPPSGLVQALCELCSEMHFGCREG